MYFPPSLYDALEDALISYGESVLGCRAITPIWMSYYVDGCCQELHCDNPHGPFAFVLSLTGARTGKLGRVGRGGVERVFNLKQCNNLHGHFAFVLSLTGVC